MIIKPHHRDGILIFNQDLFFPSKGGLGTTVRFIFAT